MSSENADAESKVSGNQANIPAEIRREFAIDDGDQLRWFVDEAGALRVEIVHRKSGTFADFEGYDGEQTTDAASDHDAWSVE